MSAPASPFRLFLRARRIAAMALAFALIELGHKLDPRLRQALPIVETELRLREIERSLGPLQERLRQVPARRRPRFTTEQARAVLRLFERSGASLAELAAAVLTTAQTLRRWIRRRNSAPDHQLVLGPATRPQPPCTRISDPTRTQVAGIRSQAALLGKKLTSAMLAVAGCRISTSSVGRMTHRAHIETAAPRTRVPTLVTTGARAAGRLGRRRHRPGAALPPEMPPPALSIAPLDSRRRARLFLELRDHWHLGLIALLRPLRGFGVDALSVRLTPLHDREAHLLELRRILRERLARVRPTQRPHYTPAARAQILTYKHHLGLSDRATAAVFLLARQTIGSWEADVDRGEEARLVQPDPPMAGPAHAILPAGQIVPALTQPHQAAVTASLAQLTSPAAPRRRETPPAAANSRNQTSAPRRPTRRSPIRPRHPNHYWSVDLTELHSLFGVYRPYLAVILDLYSRFPVAFRLWPRRPDSADVAQLLEDALAAWGPPHQILVSHLVTDQGGEFTGEPFEHVLTRHHIHHRFGAVGEHGSIAHIERLWLTLKTALDDRDLPHLRFDDIERRVAAAIDWYARLRPHSSLRNAIPQERYLGLRPACHDAAPPPRGHPGQLGVPHDDIELRFALPEEIRLPYLVRRAVA